MPEIDNEQKGQIYDRVYKPGFDPNSEAIKRRQQAIAERREAASGNTANASPGFFETIKEKFTNLGVGDADLALQRRREMLQQR